MSEVFKTLQANAETARHVAAAVLEGLTAAAVQGDILSAEKGSMQYSIMPRSERQREEDIGKLRFILPEYFSQ